MIPRSLHFRLSLYHVSLLTLTLLVFAGTSYWGFRRHLIASLEAQCASQTRQIAVSLLPGLPKSGIQYLRDEMEEHYAPESNNLFFRIVNTKNEIIYESGLPRDKNLVLEPTQFNADLKQTRTHLDTDRHRLVFLRPYQAETGESYQIQMSTSIVPIERDLEGLWKAGLLVLPFALLGSVVGGFLLSKRSLKPVREVIVTAGKINTNNLRERLQESQTGDEIEQLTATLNKMFERLDASFKQMIRFTADASHELRTPLTVIRGNLELLMRHQSNSQRERNPEETKEMLAQTLEETERLSKIVGQLLELTQLDSGEIQLEQEVFDLAELTNTTAEQMKLLAEDKGILLEIKDVSPLPIRGDRHRIKQLLLNLIDNAIKYCPS